MGAPLSWGSQGNSEVRRSTRIAQLGQNEKAAELQVQKPRKKEDVGKLNTTQSMYSNKIKEMAAHHIDEADGDHNKASGFWYDREEQKARQPWPKLEQLKADIEETRKVPLDPIALQLEMEEDADAAREKLRTKRRFVPKKGFRSSKAVPSTAAEDDEAPLTLADMALCSETRQKRRRSEAASLESDRK
ncbi:hypothetical protein GGS24DRAFT_294358 [Hypoxylon argillaceum]|nr:hypothetical protein GGS24DRAFT_294358 [Hypoxylon argillaceum]